MDFVFWDDAFRLRDSTISGDSHSKLLTKQKRLPKRDFYFLGFYNNATLNSTVIFLPSESARAAQKLFSCIECTAVECKTEAFCVQICNYLLILAEFNRNIYKRRNAYPYSEELIDLLRIYVELEYETLYGNISYTQSIAKLQESWDEKVKKRVLDILYITFPCCYDYNYNFHGGMEPFNVELSRDMHVFQLLKSVKLKYQRKTNGFIKIAMKDIIHSNGEMSASVDGLLGCSISKAWTDKSISFLTEQGIHSSLTKAIPESINDCLKLYNISPDLDLSYDLLEVTSKNDLDDLESIGKHAIQSIVEDDLDLDGLFDNDTVDLSIMARRFLLPPANISTQYIDCQNTIKVESVDEEYDKDEDPKIPDNGILRSKSIYVNKKSESSNDSSSINTRCTERKKSTKEIIVGRIVISDDEDDDVVHVGGDQKSLVETNLACNYVTDESLTSVVSNGVIDSALEVLAAQAVEQRKVEIDSANVSNQIDTADVVQCMQLAEVEEVKSSMQQNSQSCVSEPDSQRCSNDLLVSDCNIADVQSAGVVSISQSPEVVVEASKLDSVVVVKSVSEISGDNCSENIDGSSNNDTTKFDIDKKTRISTPSNNELLIDDTSKVDDQNNITCNLKSNDCKVIVNRINRDSDISLMKNELQLISREITKKCEAVLPVIEQSNEIIDKSSNFVDCQLETIGNNVITPILDDSQSLIVSENTLLNDCQTAIEPIIPILLSELDKQTSTSCVELEVNEIIKEADVEIFENNKPCVDSIIVASKDDAFELSVDSPQVSDADVGCVLADEVIKAKSDVSNVEKIQDEKDEELGVDVRSDEELNSLAKKSPEKNTNHSIETILSPAFKELPTKSSSTQDDSSDNTKNQKTLKIKKDNTKKRKSIRTKADLKGFESITYSDSTNVAQDLPKPELVTSEIRQNYYNSIPDDSEQTSSYASGREIDPLVRGAMPVTINDDKEEPILRNTGFNVTNTNMPNDETPVEEFLFPVLLDMEIPTAKEPYDVNEIDQTSKDDQNKTVDDGESQNDSARQINNKINNRTVTIGKINKTLYECLPLSKDTDTWITNDCSAGFLSPALRASHNSENSDQVAAEDVEKLLLSSQYNCSLEVISDIRNLGPQQLFEASEETAMLQKCVMINNSNIRVEVMDPAHVNNMILHPVSVTQAVSEQNRVGASVNELPTDPLIEINENTVEEILQISNTQIRDDKDKDMDTHIKIIEDVVASAAVVDSTSKVIVECINAQSMYDTVKTLKEKLSYSQYFSPKQTKQKRNVRRKGNKRNITPPVPKSPPKNLVRDDGKVNKNPNPIYTTANITHTSKSPNDTFNRLLEEYRGSSTSKQTNTKLAIVASPDDILLGNKRPVKTTIQSPPISPVLTDTTKKSVYLQTCRVTNNSSPTNKAKKHNPTDADYLCKDSSSNVIESARSQKSPLSASMPLLPLTVRPDLSSKGVKSNRSQKASNINSLTEKLQQRRTESGNPVAITPAQINPTKPCQYVSPAYDKDYEDMKKYEQRYRREVQRPAQRKTAGVSAQHPQQFMMYPHNAGVVAGVSSAPQPFRQEDVVAPMQQQVNQPFRHRVDVHPPCERGCDNCINRNNNHLKVPQKPKKLNRDIYQQIFPTLLTSKNLPHFWKE